MACSWKVVVFVVCASLGIQYTAIKTIRTYGFYMCDVSDAPPHCFFTFGRMPRLSGCAAQAAASAAAAAKGTAGAGGAGATAGTGGTGEDSRARPSELAAAANVAKIVETAATATAAPKRKHILIFATTRSGSSFMGQLFNQNPEVFYLFEPLYHVQATFVDTGLRFRHAVDRRALLGAYRDLLRNLFDCDLYFLENYIRPAPRDHETARLFRRGASNALCSPPVCGDTPTASSSSSASSASSSSSAAVSSLPSSSLMSSSSSSSSSSFFSPPSSASSSSSSSSEPEEQRCLRACGPLNVTLATRACHARPHVAIKTVRIPEVRDLRLMADDPRLDLKIVHLVRDPRAVLASRMLTFTETFKAWKIWNATGRMPYRLDAGQITATCDDFVRSARTGMSRPRWLRGRYLLVRYEDLARDPLGKAADIYRFAGIPMGKAVTGWVLSNTRGDNQLGRYKYSTSRDSAAAAEGWRLSLSYDIARYVQEACNDTLAQLGYRAVESADELRNLSLSLVEERAFVPFL
ncbi:carbohydrate sulfotransferase 1 [Petromyzon marinus]|uniref:carbohydrate sulfotransferase 1 n=1 Tax=Petromyzon marinus TaxID=7757 RepID=UPI003F72CF53